MLTDIGTEVQRHQEAVEAYTPVRTKVEAFLSDGTIVDAGIFWQLADDGLRKSRTHRERNARVVIDGAPLGVKATTNPYSDPDAGRLSAAAITLDITPQSIPALGRNVVLPSLNSLRRYWKARDIENLTTSLSDIPALLALARE